MIRGHPSLLASPATSRDARQPPPLCHDSDNSKSLPASWPGRHAAGTRPKIRPSQLAYSEHFLIRILMEKQKRSDRHMRGGPLYRPVYLVSGPLSQKVIDYIKK